MRSLFVIATQRTGTNALRYALAASGLFVDHNEIFSPRHREGGFAAANFWNFRRHVEAADRPFLRLDEHRQIWKLYLEHIGRQHPPDVVHLFDIKVNSLHQFNGVLWNPLDKPALLGFLGEARACVIHLQRRNLVAMFASTLRGLSSGTWVVRNEDVQTYRQTLQQKQTLPVGDLLRYIAHKEVENTLVNSWMQELEGSGARVLRLQYENLFAPDKTSLAADCAQAVTDLAGLPPCPASLFPLRTFKMTPPLSACVENYHSEVVPALRKAGYEKYLEQC